MKNRIAATLALGAIYLAQPLASLADQLDGRWIVRSIKSTTLSLDGKEKIKGPFTEKPEMTITVNRTSFVEDTDELSQKYKLRKIGKNYSLTRNDEGEQIKITLSEVRHNGHNLRYKSTRINKEREERYVVEWNCVSALAFKPIAIVGTSWKLLGIGYDDDKIVNPKEGEKMTLAFGRDGKATGNAGINRFNGKFEVGKGSSLKFGQFAMTRAMNPPDSIADEYAKALSSAKRYDTNKEKTILQVFFAKGVMKFERVHD